MPKIINESAIAKSTAPAIDKDIMYDSVAQCLANLLTLDVADVKPKISTDVDENGKKVRTKTGSYGLAFEIFGRVITVEICVKNEDVTMDDFVVTAITSPDEVDEAEDETEG